jgi:SnoaL-like domain
MLTGIDRLEAIGAIQKLPLSYSVAIEHRDVDAMAALFSPNAHFGPYGVGRSGLRALMSASMATSIFAVILVANHLVEMDGDDQAHGEVWARCYAQNDPGEYVEQLIKYEDSYERIEGRWLFLRRRHRLWFGLPADPSPLDQAEANWPQRQVGVGDVPLADPVFANWYSQRRPSAP